MAAQLQQSGIKKNNNKTKKKNVILISRSIIGTETSLKPLCSFNEENDDDYLIFRSSVREGRFRKKILRICANRWSTSPRICPAKYTFL